MISAPESPSAVSPSSSARWASERATRLLSATRLSSTASSSRSRPRIWSVRRLPSSCATGEVAAFGSIREMRISGSA